MNRLSGNYASWTITIFTINKADTAGLIMNGDSVPAGHELLLTSKGGRRQLVSEKLHRLSHSGSRMAQLFCENAHDLFEIAEFITYYCR